MSTAWFETVSSRRVYEGFSTVRVDEVRTPDGELVAREVVEHADAVAVVALTAVGEVVLLRQYRQPVGGYLLELPAGKLDVDGEAPDAAARRELHEEAGHRVAGLTLLTTMWNSAGWCDERTYLYLGSDAAPIAPDPDFVAEAEEAHLEIVLLPLADAAAAVRDGVITDAKTVAGLLLAEAWSRR